MSRSIENLENWDGSIGPKDVMPCSSSSSRRIDAACDIGDGRTVSAHISLRSGWLLLLLPLLLSGLPDRGHGGRMGPNRRPPRSILKGLDLIRWLKARGSD